MSDTIFTYVVTPEMLAYKILSGFGFDVCWVKSEDSHKELLCGEKVLLKMRLPNGQLITIFEN